MNSSKEKIFGFDFRTFFNLINNMYDEVYITDDNYKCLYVNKACARHYGASQDEMIGKTSAEFLEEGWWSDFFLYPMYKDKEAYVVKQILANGMPILTIAVPMFDDENNIKYVVMNVRDDVKDVLAFNDSYESEFSNNTLISSKYIFKSDLMKKIYALASKISNIDATCIITGETGVGKTLLANHIHKSSPRKDKPFISVNCATLPSELIESELFGYSKGAFTGANQTGKKGLVSMANGGTLLLDEISELPPSAQAKILHMVQEKEFIPVGGNEPVKVDVRIIAATNKSLKSLVNLGQFREDLYYRLNVVDLYIPPLRKRTEDIPPLVYYFLSEFSSKYNINRQITERAMEILVNHEWRGNIRELRHIIEKMFITSDTVSLDLNQLPTSLFNIDDENCQYDDDEDSTFADKVDSYEGYLIRNAYKKYGTSRKVAEKLHLSQSKANRLIQKYVNK